MKSRATMKVGGCPSCGADIEFRPGAGPVKVCDHCSTVVFKGDSAKLEARGKVAELLDLDSPLSIGLTGRFSGTAFTVVGRVQKTNGKANWDEWYVAFEDERTGWLAESEGEWKLLFPLTDLKAPSPKPMEPLGTFTLREKTFTVEERHEARTLSAQGQLPSFHASHVYVDATGPKGVFATLDEAGDECEAYVGSFVSLKDLALDEHDLRPTKREALKQARCTQCNGPLDLKAPDATKRVACPYCGALLEVQRGALSFLELLEKPPFEPQLPLGATAKLPDFTAAEPRPTHEWACIAFLIRSCTVEGTRYPWEEYLLWNRALGFRWVMHSVGHWTWLTPTGAGEVAFSERTVDFRGQRFRSYQSVYAKTEYVAGECYWQVEAGEVAKADEYIAPPRSLNVDRTPNEATVTEGVLIDPEQLEKAFGLKKKLVRPFGIAPAQPNPFADKMKDAWTWALVWGGVMVALMIVFAALGTTEQYFEGSFSVPPAAASGSAEAQRFAIMPFEIKATVPLEVEVSAPGLSNNWLGVSVDLVNDKTSEVVAVYAEPSYYSGVTDGESWSEGSTSATVQTDVVEKGTYVLRVTPSFEAGRATDYHVKVSADDGAGFLCPLLIFLLLLAAPLYYSVRANSFETQKWNDAVFQPSPTVSTFPYAKNTDDDDD